MFACRTASHNGMTAGQRITSSSSLPSSMTPLLLAASNGFGPMRMRLLRRLLTWLSVLLARLLLLGFLGMMTFEAEDVKGE